MEKEVWRKACACMPLEIFWKNRPSTRCDITEDTGEVRFVVLIPGRMLPACATCQAEFVLEREAEVEDDR